MAICNSIYVYIIIIFELNDKRIDFTTICFSLCRYFLPFGAAVKILQF